MNQGIPPNQKIFDFHDDVLKVYSKDDNKALQEVITDINSILLVLKQYSTEELIAILATSPHHFRCIEEHKPTLSFERYKEMLRTLLNFIYEKGLQRKSFMVKNAVDELNGLQDKSDNLLTFNLILLKRRMAFDRGVSVKKITDQDVYEAVGYSKEEIGILSNKEVPISNEEFHKFLIKCVQGIEDYIDSRKECDG